MQDILLIIPSYNEEKNIETVVGELVEKFPQLDYLVVNDGSADRTGQICRERGYHMLDLPVNLGLAGCFQAGMKYAYRKGYRYAIQFDGDGQHRPEYIEGIRRKMDEGYDIVIGSRFVDRPKDWSARMLGSRLLSGAIRLTTGQAICDPTSGMRMFNRAMLEEFSTNLNYGPEPDTISYLIKNGAVVREVQVEMGERTAGKSYLNFVRSVEYMTKMGLSILLIQWFRKRDTDSPYAERSV